ncbi:MAG: recombination mediator RecR [Cyclobacteriaceae bacterium]|nr:recombination mediator RecR [Cyclobacteriaceae bacterium]
MEYPSKLIENAVEEISKLPGIGKKTALRLALHLLKQEKEGVRELSTALVELRENTQYCQSCFNISDSNTCAICSSYKRDGELICVVEDTRDVMAIENTSQYFGLYHVLGGIIMPIEGIGPADLTIQALINRIVATEGQVKEVILALPATMEGDTTAFYITKKLKEVGVKVTSIARGVPVGGELEYTDEITLGRSIMNRL